MLANMSSRPLDVGGCTMRMPMWSVAGRGAQQHVVSSVRDALPGGAFSTRVWEAGIASLIAPSVWCEGRFVGRTDASLLVSERLYARRLCVAPQLV